MSTLGQGWYTTISARGPISPERLQTIVAGDFDGDGDDDIAGINPAGVVAKVFYTTDLSTGHRSLA